MNHAEQRQPDTKDYALCGPLYVKFQRIGWGQKLRGMVASRGREGGQKRGVSTA